MKNIKNNKTGVGVVGFLSLLILKFGLPSVSYAHCPLCVAGAGVGLSLSRWIGLDDSITGLWMAAFLGAMSFWSYIWLSKKLKIKNTIWLKPTVYILIFTTTLWSFYKFNLIIRMEQMYGLDKLTFGIIVGGITFYLVETLNDLIMRIRGKSFFRYQRIVFSLGSILALSIFFDILIGYYI